MHTQYEILCVYALVHAHEHVNMCVLMRTCVHACVGMYLQYPPLTMHTNTMATAMIVQAMITSPTIPTTTGTTEDEDEDAAARSTALIW